MTEKNAIKILGARSNNLKGIDCVIARNAMTVISGVSGSGKSTLAFDTLFAEGQRRYVESLSAYARQFLQKMARPDVEAIENIPPAIAIEQRNRVKNARSTVGTVTEIHDYLRLLFAKIGQLHCPTCKKPIVRDTARTVLQHLLATAVDAQVVILSETRRALEHAEERALLRERFLRDGLRRVLVIEGKKAHAFADLEEEATQKKSWVGVVLDRITVRADKSARLLESLELGFVKGAGELLLYFPDRPQNPFERFYSRLQCKTCEAVYDELKPVQFSFNNPLGACPECEGFGRATGLDMERIIPDPTKTLREGAIDPFSKPAYRESMQDLATACTRLKIPMNKPWNDLTPEQQALVIEGQGKWYGIRGLFKWLETKRYKTHVRIFIARYRGYTTCPSCNGDRLNKTSLSVYMHGKNLTDLSRTPVQVLRDWFKGLAFTEEEKEIAKPVMKELENRLRYLCDVGLGYLTLARQARTLSGGEAQRIALATALGTSLTDTLYVLDEPSIGLHPRDSARLLKVLFSLRNLGNTIVVVEHDPAILARADAILDLGPEAGRNGGQIIFEGTYDELLRDENSLTGQYLRGRKKFFARPARRKPKDWITVKGAAIHNLKKIDVKFPLGVLCAVTGVSGAGKSSLAHQILFAGFQLYRGQRFDEEAGHFTKIEGFEKIQDMILMDQSAVGKSIRSNPATYLGFYSGIRQVFAGTKEAKRAGLLPGAFSFNVAGGRCETCCGAGIVTVDMQFLDDVQVTCEACEGRRFTPKVLDIRYREKNITDILHMTVEEAAEFFAAYRDIAAPLQLLKDVGLHYLTLGQSTSTLSGGEAQRLKLAAHMAERSKQNCLYLFDEPTTGLHLRDIENLLRCFDRLVELGNTVVVIEHNLDLIYASDHVIDLGPEGGDGGGQIVAEGTPEQVMSCVESYTGRYLREYQNPGENHLMI